MDNPIAAGSVIFGAAREQLRSWFMEIQGHPLSEAAV
jgi:hypothetical protein